MDQNEYIDDLISKFEDSFEFATVKIIQYYKGKSKSEIKSVIEEMNTSTIKFFWFDVFEKREEYEMCQAFKEVLDERYSDQDKFRNNAAREINEAFELIQQVREITGNGIDVTSWNEILGLIEDPLVAVLYYELFPIEKILLREMEWYRKRFETNQNIIVEAEIGGMEDIPIPSLKSRLRSIYPYSEFETEITGKKITFTFNDADSVKKVIEFIDYLPLAK